MGLKDRVVRSVLVPPGCRKGVVRRPRLEALLLRALDYPLTLVHAGTGYGKSTALSSLSGASCPLFWYTITEPHRDPVLFFAHLVSAFERLDHHGCKTALAQLERSGSQARIGPELLTPLVNALTDCLETDSVLVIDDYHFVAGIHEVTALVEHLLRYRPPRLHLVLSSRQRPHLAWLAQATAKGQVLSIDHADLAFTSEEVERLFREQYGHPLTPPQVTELMARTEGWAIGLQVIWQSLHGRQKVDVEEILRAQPSRMEVLFEYLAEEVLARQAPDLQDFLLQTSVLRELRPECCDQLLNRNDSALLLARLEEEGLFIVRLGEAYRYHHLFHDFLRQQAAQVLDAPSLHRDAARFYRERDDREEAIHHYLMAQEYEAAAALMVDASEVLVRDGRLDTLSSWVTALAPAVLQQAPDLMFRMGELNRYASRFDEALAWYEQARERYESLRDPAGQSRALRGEAAVYLDTVRPIRAESLLQEALQLVDGQQDREARASLLELMAENMTNRGRWQEAAAFQKQAREAREEGPGRGDLDVRILLRTGRLEDARLILEERAAEGRYADDHFREPRAHRETLLVLSLVCALEGRSEQAFSTAQEGIELGKRLGSPFVQAVGYMRLGHSWQISGLPGASDEARGCYLRAIEISERLAVQRIKVEALWGLCRVYGFAGDLTAAKRSAEEGIRIGLAAGDDWIAALVTATLGASFVVAGRPSDALYWLERSRSAFEDCGDPFGQCGALLWLCLADQMQCGSKGKTELEDPSSIARLERLLCLVESNQFGFLFTRLNFSGPDDPATLVPLLIRARQQGLRPKYAGRLLYELGLDMALDFHPGYSLRVHTLGQFDISRGSEPITDADWQREKSRRLFQALLTHRGRFVQRGELAAWLWPEADEPSSQRLFKVTLNAMHEALERGRPPRAATVFVQRRGSSYGINPSAPLWHDATAFESLLRQADAARETPQAITLYRRALDLYRGDYLPECLYEDWSSAERERLRQLRLRALTSLAERLLQLGDWASAIEACQQALEQDPCMESACRLRIRAHLAAGDKVEAQRAYDRCVTALREELGVSPAPETLSLLEEMRALD